MYRRASAAKDALALLATLASSGQAEKAGIAVVIKGGAGTAQRM